MKECENCGAWDKDKEECMDVDTFVNRSDGESCCRYHPEAIPSYEYELDSLRASAAEKDAEIERQAARISEMEEALKEVKCIALPYLNQTSDMCKVSNIANNALLSTPTGAKEKKVNKESGHKWYCDYAADDETHCLICHKTSSEINGQPCQGAHDGAKEVERVEWTCETCNTNNPTHLTDCFECNLPRAEEKGEG